MSIVGREVERNDKDEQLAPLSIEAGQYNKKRRSRASSKYFLESTEKLT